MNRSRALQTGNPRTWLMCLVIATMCLLSLRATAQSYFPPVCTVLHAQLHDVDVASHAAEDHRDTARLQAALNACSAGQAVELTASRTSNVLLSAPLQIPSGVTLLIDAGVTLYGSSDPSVYRTGAATDASPCGGDCIPLITAQPGTQERPTAVMGFGVLDGGGQRTLLEPRSQPRSWYDLPAAARPTLISAGSDFRLYKLTLRHAPADAVRFTGAEHLRVDGAKIISDDSAANATRGLVLSAAAKDVTITESSISTIAEDVETAAAAATLQHVLLYQGAGLAPTATDHNHCVVSSAPAPACLPATLPAYAGELFLSTAAVSNLHSAQTAEAVTLTAVLTAPEAATPEADEDVSFYDGTLLLGKARAHAGLATLTLSGLRPGGHTFTAAYQSAGLQFGEVQLLVPRSATAQDSTSLSLSVDYPNAPLNTYLHFTASAAAGTSGSVSFYDGATLLGSVVLDNTAIATFAIASLPQGTHTVSAGLTADTRSNLVSVTIAGVPTALSLSSDHASLFTLQKAQFTAQGLPPGATGSVVFLDNEQPAATVVLGGPSAPGLVAFGDFITSGSALPDPSAAYPQRIAADLGMTVTNAALPGAGACDIMLMQVFPANAGPTQTSAPLSSLMVGTLDSTSLANEQSFRTCHQAALAWLAIPRDSKVLAGDPAVQTLSGSWKFSGQYSNDSTYRTLYNTSGSGAARFPLHTTGQPIYLWYLLDDAHAGTFRVTLDGVDSGTIYNVQLPNSSNSSLHAAIALLRLPAAAGDHTIDTTVLSGNAGFLGVGTAPAAGVHPTVLAADLPAQNQAMPYFPPAVLQQLSADALADASLLAQDGLDIRAVATRPYFSGDPANMVDGTAPNALGQLQLAAAFENVLSGVSLLPYKAANNAATVQQLILQTPGPHTIKATYSGDVTYAPAVSQPLIFQVADSTSSVTISTSATDLPAGAAVTFTAGVSPAVATGTLRFFEVKGGVLGEVAVHAGAGSLTLSLPTGKHPVYVEFQSDQSYQNSQSAVVTVVLEPPPASLSLAVEAASVPYDRSLTLRATATPQSATGTVTFSVPGVGVVGAAAIVNGAAQMNSPLLPAGDYSVLASYPGDAANGPAVSPAQPLHITGTAVATLQVPVATITGVYGSPITIHADLLTGTIPSLPAAPAHFSTALNSTTAFMGDSITQYWPLPINNFGIAGQTSAAMLSRFAGQIPGHGYERVLILAGTNDILHTTSDTATILGNIDAMVQQATAAGMRVILATIPNITSQGVDMNDRVRPLNAALHAYTQANGLLLVDYNATLNATPLPLGDGIHPNSDGYALMESELAHTLLLPGGTISLPDGSSATISASSTAAVTSSAMPGGHHTVLVQYSGDRNFQPATAPITLEIATAAPLVQLQVQPLAQPLGTAAHLTATVSFSAHSTPTGKVTLLDNNQPLNTVDLDSSGHATLLTGNLQSGSHAFTASYSGDGNFSPGNSTAAALNVRFLQSALTLTAPNTTFVYGAPITLTAALASTSATGTALLFEDTQLISQQPVIAGVAAIALAQFGVGQHTFTVRYSGDTYDSAASSPPLTITITPAASSLSLQPLPASVSYGTAVTLSASLSSDLSVAGGTVTFTEGSRTLAQVPLVTSNSSKTASVTLPNLPVGDHVFNASYSGDGNTAPANALAVSTSVTALVSTLNLSADSITLAYGSAAVLSVTLTPPAATGNVTLTDALTGVTAQLTPNAGKASFSAAGLSVGTHTFTAAYAGDSTTAASRSQSVPVVVQQASTALTLAAPPASLTIGTTLDLTVTVVPAAASGVVTFRDSKAGVLGQATLVSGHAILSLPALPQGSYSISATYAGDANYAGSSSQPVSTSVVLIQSTTAIVATPVTSSFGQEVTLFAAVSPAGVQGTLTFYDSGQQVLGSVLMQGTSATLKLSSLALGAHTVHASFAGDTTHAASDSVSLAIQVVPDNTVTSLTLAQNPLPVGTAAIFNVQVTSGSAVTPTGAVTIRSGARVLAIGMLSHGQNSVAYATISVDSAALGVGSLPVVAYYAGDTVSSLSNSAANPVTLQINPDLTQATLSLSASQVPVQTATTLTATITSPTSGLVPTGAVTFLLNGTTLATANLNSAGVASVTVPPQQIGSYTLSATYTASGFFAAATMLPRSLTVTAPLNIAFKDAALTAATGSAPNAALTLTPLSNFAGAVSTQCSTSASFLSCTVEAPATVNGSPVGATLHLHVASTLAALNQPAATGKTLPISFAALGLLLLPLTRLRRQLRRLHLVAAALLVSLAIMAGGLTGCGTGGNFYTVPAGVQTVTVTVTAAGVATSAQLPVTITH